MENISQKLNHLLDQKNYRSQFQEMMEEVLAHPDVVAFMQEYQEVLTKSDIERSYAKLYEFVQEKQKFEIKKLHLFRCLFGIYPI